MSDGKKGNGNKKGKREETAKVVVKSQKVEDSKNSLQVVILTKGIIIIVIILIFVIGALIGFNSWVNRPVIATEKVAETVQETATVTTAETKAAPETTAATVSETTVSETSTEATSETTAVETTTEATDKVATEVVEATGAFSMGWEKDWRMSTVPKTKSLPDEKTQEFFNEPGVYPGYDGRQVAWDVMEDSPSSINIPHDAGTYISGAYMNLLLEQGNIPIVSLPYQEGLNYLVFLRGLPLPEGELGEHYNRTVLASDYAEGHVINSLMPEGAYFSLNWTIDQINNCFEELKCNKVIVVAIDIQTRSIRSWEITGLNGDWKRIDLL